MAAEPSFFAVSFAGVFFAAGFLAAVLPAVFFATGFVVFADGLPPEPEAGAECTEAPAAMSPQIRIVIITGVFL